MRIQARKGLARVAACSLLLALFGAVANSPALAQNDGDDELTVSDDRDVAVILQVSGLLDRVVAEFVSDHLAKAADDGARLVVLWVNSQGAIVDEATMRELGATIDTSPIPVAMWIGPSGAQALGGWAELASRVDRIGIAPGSRLGKLETAPNPLTTSRWGDHAPTLARGTVDNLEAITAGITPAEAPIIGEFLTSLSDLGIETEAVEAGTQLRTVVRFERLNLFEQQMHTVASPPVAYLLFLIGMALLVFEFYTAGVGVAGVVGAFMFLLGGYGLAALPTRPIAILLLVLAMFAFSIDVQTGVPRLWTIIGAVLTVGGTVSLYTDGVSMSWIPMLVGVVGISVMMWSGMPTMVRSRFATSTIGREWMIGATGVAVEDITPDGVVKIEQALWRARTNRATPIESNDTIRVIGIEGLVLEVEPEHGGARDYRDRKPKPGADQR